MEKLETDLKHDHASPGMVEDCRSPAINHFDRIADEIVTCIFCKLSSTSNHPRDFLGALLVCKRFNMLGGQPTVLRCASQSLCTSWKIDFITKCADSGNMEACYTLGMLDFYCFKRREKGLSLLEKAANASHSNATFALAIIKFNGSGGGEESKDLQAGIELCKKAIVLGHKGANIELIIREVLDCDVGRIKQLRIFGNYLNCDSTNKIVKELPEWFSNHPPGNALKLCSNIGCRRPETRKDEFRQSPHIRCRKEFFCSDICSLWSYKKFGHTCIG